MASNAFPLLLHIILHRMKQLDNLACSDFQAGHASSIIRWPLFITSCRTSSHYRNTPHATTGSSPVSLFLVQSICARLDLQQPTVYGCVRPIKMDRSSVMTIKHGDMSSLWERRFWQEFCETRHTGSWALSWNTVVLCGMLISWMPAQCFVNKWITFACGCLLTSVTQEVVSPLPLLYRRQWHTGTLSTYISPPTQGTPTGRSSFTCCFCKEG